MVCIQTILTSLPSLARRKWKPRNLRTKSQSATFIYFPFLWKRFHSSLFDFVIGTYWNLLESCLDWDPLLRYAPSVAIAGSKRHELQQLQRLQVWGGEAVSRMSRRAWLLLIKEISPHPTPKAPKAPKVPKAPKPWCYFEKGGCDNVSIVSGAKKRTTEKVAWKKCRINLVDMDAVSGNFVSHPRAISVVRTRANTKRRCGILHYQLV